MKVIKASECYCVSLSKSEWLQICRHYSDLGGILEFINLKAFEFNPLVTVRTCTTNFSASNYDSNQGDLYFDIDTDQNDEVDSNIEKSIRMFMLGFINGGYE